MQEEKHFFCSYCKRPHLLGAKCEEDTEYVLVDLMFEIPGSSFQPVVATEEDIQFLSSCGVMGKVLKKKEVRQ